MKTETKILLTVLALTVILLVGGVFFLSSKQPQGTTNQDGSIVYPIDYSRGQKIGTDSAKVKLVEFGDLRCPACKAYEPTVSQIRQKYQNNADFQLIFRHFAFLGPASVVAANAAECAGEQGKFWQYHDYLYDHQPAETDTSMYVSDKLTPVAEGLGLNGSQFKACLDSSKYAKNIADDRSQGQSIGVNSTPTFYLNGKKLILNNLSDLATNVDNALK